MNDIYLNTMVRILESDKVSAQDKLFAKNEIGLIGIHRIITLDLDNFKKTPQDNSDLFRSYIQRSENMIQRDAGILYPIETILRDGPPPLPDFLRD